VRKSGINLVGFEVKLRIENTIRNFGTKAPVSQNLKIIMLRRIIK
jgi:hypothetical protein